MEAGFNVSSCSVLFGVSLRQEQEFPNCLSPNGPLGTSLQSTPASKARAITEGAVLAAWQRELPQQPFPSTPEATGGRKVNTNIHHPNARITCSSFMGASLIPSNTESFGELKSVDE